MLVSPSDVVARAKATIKECTVSEAKQNLWQFHPDTEHRIVAYLAENYPPDAARRRAAIPRELMPPNPYAYTNAN